MTAKPNMLVLARDSRGMTQSHLAKELGVPQGTVSKWENGLYPITDSTAELLSIALRYPVAFFYEDFAKRELPVAFFRKRFSVREASLRQLRAGTEIWRLRLERLLRPIALPESRVPAIDIAGGWTPQQAAEEVRRYWALPVGPVANMTQLLEGAGVVVVRRRMEESKIDGFGIGGCGDPMVIFVNSATPPDRQRFTLAHELAHFVLHSHTLPALDRDTEAEADQFASAFLLPRREFAAHFTRPTLPQVAQQKAYWKVSMAAIAMRAAGLGLITESQKRYFFMQLSKAGQRKEEPTPFAAEQPVLVRQAVDLHLTRLDYSVGQLAESLRADRDEFEEHFLEKDAPFRVISGGR